MVASHDPDPANVLAPGHPSAAAPPATVSGAAALPSNLDADDLRDLRKSAVDNLERIYTLVAGLSLAAAVAKLITVPGFPAQAGPVPHVWRLSRVEFHYDTLPMFIALVVTLVPFYHGANRYLFSTYVFRDSRRHMRPLSAMGDFAFFFLQALVFFAMSLVLAETVPFFWAYLVLLALDCLWILFVLQQSKEHFTSIQFWLWTNAGAGIIVALVLLAEHIQLAALLPDRVIVDDAGRSIILMVVAITRTIIDYWKSWPIYWPGFHESTAA